MALLYRSIRLLLRGAVELYFVDIQSAGRENIPARGPLIFAANHPNSIMDTVILGTQTQRIISYLARSGLFKNPIVGAIFRHCGVIPVYRAQDDPSQMHRNQNSFQKAYELLGEGGSIGIFPEGKNSMERSVQEIKTGTARIALGAEAEQDYALDLKIIPVGLNFVNRDRFLSRVLIRFGEPIQVSDYAQLHREDPTRAVKALTDKLQTRIEEEATHIEGEIAVQLTRDIYQIYGSKLLQSLVDEWHSPKSLTSRLMDEVKTHARPTNLQDVFQVKQLIADAIHHFQHTDPELLEAVSNKILAYKDHLSQVKLRHDFLDRRPETISVRTESIKFTLYALLFAPFALWGLLLNVLPYSITHTFAVQAPDEAMRAIRAFGLGMLAFPLWYGLISWGAWSTHLVSIWWILAALFTVPLTGFFYLRYRRQLARYRDRIMARTLMRTDRSLVLALAAEREKLLDLFDALRQRFVQETNTQMGAPAAPEPG